MNKRLACTLAILFALVSAPAFSQTESLEDETIARLQQYLRVDTTNPPGNETRAVEFFAKFLKAEGIPYETAESAPGRGNLWARLEGGDEPALVLLNHTDVVPADESHWSVDPLAGEIRNGQLYGRGALDMKSTGMLPWCITLDNSKGISRLRFWAKNRRVNGINDLPVFMHQGRFPGDFPDLARRTHLVLLELTETFRGVRGGVRPVYAIVPTHLS